MTPVSTTLTVVRTTTVRGSVLYFCDELNPSGSSALFFSTAGDPEDPQTNSKRLLQSPLISCGMMHAVRRFSGFLATTLLLAALAAISSAQVIVTMYTKSSTCTGAKQVVSRPLPYCMSDSGALISACSGKVWILTRCMNRFYMSALWSLELCSVMLTLLSVMPDGGCMRITCVSAALTAPAPS